MPCYELEWRSFTSKRCRSERASRSLLPSAACVISTDDASSQFRVLKAIDPAAEPGKASWKPQDCEEIKLVSAPLHSFGDWDDSNLSENEPGGFHQCPFISIFRYILSFLVKTVNLPPLDNPSVIYQVRYLRSGAQKWQ